MASFSGFSPGPFFCRIRKETGRPSVVSFEVEFDEVRSELDAYVRYEGYDASVCYALLAALGVPVTVEDASAAGRLDMAVRAGGRVYRFEFKVVEQAGEGAALAQLQARGYADKYRTSGEPVHLVGVEFSPDARNLAAFETAPARAQAPIAGNRCKFPAWHRGEGRLAVHRAPSAREPVMICAVVRYPLPSSIDRAACRDHYEKIAPGFRAVPGLVSKHFICGDHGVAGGVYQWETREEAEAFYSGPWRAGIVERYGVEPEIEYFTVFCVTDNAKGEVRVLESGEAIEAA